MRVSILAALPAGLIVAVLGINVAAADVIVASTSRAGFGNDSVDWAQEGMCQAALANPFSATSAQGLTVTVTSSGLGFEGSSLTKTVQEPPGCPVGGWNGNFAPDAPVIYNESTGPVALTFSSPISGVGAQFENLLLSDFTAEIDAYNGSTLLGSVTEDGNGTTAADNSAIFLGIEDLTGADITSVIFAMSPDTPDPNGFAFNNLSLIDSAPEPASFVLFGTALLGLSLRRRRKRV